MAKIQFQKGSCTAAIPPHIIKHLNVKKGDIIEYDINKKGIVEVKVIERKEG